MNLLLIGYRGTGKTTVGRLAAARMERPFFDADLELERRAGRTIREIFASDGEPTFRDLETQTLTALLESSSAVLSLGGGVILREENRRAMRSAKNFVVLLTASVEAIFDRISSDPATGERRPNLTADGGLAEIRALLAQREAFYRECADYTFDTEAISPERIAEEIVSLWRAREAA